MAYCVDKNSDSTLFLTNIPTSECNSLVVMGATEYQQAQINLNASDISSLFFFAFGLVLLSYKTGWLISTVKRLIGLI